ncbi:MAG TPA: precorrin-6y C5,15-methyltransferase (decarboxylating) subunit CbiE [Trichocoleus sp.]|jgi:precorrin-6Y C5,15-methyltransferase (decarboxylating)
MTPIHVIGIGLDGAVSLTESVRQTIEQATLLVGSARHLSYFAEHPADRLILGDFRAAIECIRQHLAHTSEPQIEPQIIILTSGDPLFFGLGRLLLAELPSEQMTFHPHLSSVQLAFSRIKVPWQDAHLISAHGRSLDELTRALQQGAEKIAILTDHQNTPATIARLLIGLELPGAYQAWVCENLGSLEEQVQCYMPQALVDRTFAPLNVVVLVRSEQHQALELEHLPAFGLSDHYFLSFRDRPGLITKREVRLLVLGELGLRSGQVIWDIGAGTGSVSIEIARLCPESKIYAIEQTAVGISLIQQNAQRFQVNHVVPIHGKAPDSLNELPAPDRIFIGGSGGNLEEILAVCQQQIQPDGIIVLALATLEHLTTALDWLKSEAADRWNHHLLQVQLSRSVPIAALTRFAPLNPVTLLTLTPNPKYSSRHQ